MSTHPLDGGDGILGFSEKASPRRLDFAGMLAAIRDRQQVAREAWPAGTALGKLGGDYVRRDPPLANERYPEARFHRWEPKHEDLDATDWMVVL